MTSDVPLPHTAESATPQPAGGGALTLKQARERSGLHVVALAAMLKVPVSKLEALEAGRFADLPDMTFARALAKSVCRQLKIDPAPILANLPQSAPVEWVHLPKGLNTAMPGSAPRVGGRPVLTAHLPWPAMVAVLLLLVAGVLWWALPPALSLEPVGVQPAIATAPSVVPEVAPPPEPKPSPSTEPLQVPSKPNPTEPVPVPVPEAAQLPEAVAPILELRASQTTWVEVVGRSGQLLLQRTLQAGEWVSFQNDAPYQVVTGRADATEVRVFGKPLDLAEKTRNNVARFSTPAKP